MCAVQKFEGGGTKLEGKREGEKKTKQKKELPYLGCYELNKKLQRNYIKEKSAKNN